MNLVSTSWSCVRCGAAFISTPPEHGLCDQCLADLEMLAQLAPIANQPCPLCGGPGVRRLRQGPGHLDPGTGNLTRAFRGGERRWRLRRSLRCRSPR
jgi:hypothetical protein